MTTTVLIAEDEPHIVELLTFLLEREGYAVTAAADGEAALTVLANTTPDLAVLDVMMPKQSGFDVLREARNDPRHKDLPIIILTARGQTRDRETAIEMGADAFIAKPFSNQDVLATLRRLGA